MIYSWEEYLVAVLLASCFVGALLSGDKKIRAGFVVLLGAWVVTQVGGYYFDLVWSVPFGIVINIGVFASFLLIARNFDRQQFFYRWPNAILMIEVMIFASHTTKFLFGQYVYAWIVNSLYDLELIILLIVSIPLAQRRVKRLYHYAKSRGLLKLIR